ncbi:MAG: transporter [Bacteroidetes bacterium B1(2017)]|nr:MAG: transporter [Bacteroidetes bacterium B1(2017)]
MISTILPEWLKAIVLPSENTSISASIVLVFLVMFSGILIGKIKIKKISLGISGVVFAGIFLGHLGYRLHEDTYEFLRDFGLILFVYAIGMQVGPSFFSRLKNDGVLYNGLAIGTVLGGGICTLLLFYTTHTGMDNLVGIMSGAVTNTPGLGAAKSALHDLNKSLPNMVFNDPTNAYAITYPFGIIGIILVMILAGKILKINTQEEIEAFQKQIKAKHPAPESAKCRVTQAAYFGQSIHTFLESNKLNLIVSRIKNAGSTQVESPSDEYVFKERDVLMFVGLPADLEKAISLLGYRSSDTFIESETMTRSKTFIVSKGSAIQKTLAQLNLENQYHIKVTRIYRSGLELLAQPDLVLHYGDRMRVVGSEKDLAHIEKLLGNSEKKLQEPQLLSIFLGIVLGVLVGSIPLALPGLSVPVKLGMAAGPLLIAIIISRFGGIKSLHSFLQQSALLFMKDFGICLFFAAIGIHAGESFYETFITYHGWVWVGYGLFITIIPILLMILVARKVFKLNFMPLLGLIAGSYTDPAALDFSTTYYKSDLPLQAYATVYPLVTIVRIILAQLLILYFAI